MPALLRPATVVLVLLMLLLAGCGQPPLLDRLKSRGTIRIATVAGPLTCFMDEKGPAGLEYELASRFARSLALEPRFLLFPTRRQALQALARGQVQMVAAATLPTRRDRRRFLLSQPWHQADLIFTHTMGSSAVKNLEEPPGEPVSVTIDSLQHERLASRLPEWPLSLHADLSEEQILEAVNHGRLTRTLANGALLTAMKSYYPFLASGTDLPPTEGFHWYFSRAHDASLKHAADSFLEARRQDGTIEYLIQRHVTRLPRRNYVTLRDFWKHVETRLPKYQALFEEAEQATGIDWRLLAAVGYQESHWRPDAVSPTGVRGIMMLTREAARRQKVDNRMDPAQSIAGGARHLVWMERRIPERIREPDRLWLTLASYNIGYGHLEDARVLTQRGGGNPDRWEDVKKFLPLLSREKYYSTVKHGKARGGEPVTYVENIRYYYRLLAWWDNRRLGLDCTSTNYPRLALKNWRRSSPHSSASTPPSTAVQ